MEHRAKSDATSSSVPCPSWQPLALFVALVLHLLSELRASAENHADYKYEVYKEEANRILVRTHRRWSNRS